VQRSVYERHFLDKNFKENSCISDLGAVADFYDHAEKNYQLRQYTGLA
jgi:hypothetical protein